VPSPAVELTVESTLLLAAGSTARATKPASGCPEAASTDPAQRAYVVGYAMSKRCITAPPRTSKPRSKRGGTVAASVEAGRTSTSKSPSVSVADQVNESRSRVRLGDAVVPATACTGGDTPARSVGVNSSVAGM
jgi:hypothetical protein